MSRVYFRADVAGLERIPASGPVLLVGNHSGGVVIADTFVFAQAFYDHFGADRHFNQLAHDLVFKFPGRGHPRAAFRDRAGIPREHVARAARRQRAPTLVYPGGDEETFRPSWESGEVHLAHRTGFVRLALEHDVPIVPVVAVGGQETALFLGPDTRLAKALKLNRLARLKVLPLVIGPPFGITLLDFPGRIPLPSKITIRVMPPIDLRRSWALIPASKRVTGSSAAGCSKPSRGSTINAGFPWSADRETSQNWRVADRLDSTVDRELFARSEETGVEPQAARAAQVMTLRRNMRSPSPFTDHIARPADRRR